MNQRAGAENGVFRGKPQKFTQVPNEVLNNRSLSNGAKGLYATIQRYLLTPNFRLRKSYLMKLSSDSKYAFEKYWTELKKSGYLFSYSQNGYGGMIWYYELLDTTFSEKPNTDGSNMDIEKFNEEESDSNECDGEIDYSLLKSKLKNVVQRELQIAGELGMDKKEINLTTEALIEAMKAIRDRSLILAINNCTAEKICRLWKKIYEEVFYSGSPDIPKRPILNKTGYVFRMTENYFKE